MSAEFIKIMSAGRKPMVKGTFRLTDHHGTAVTNQTYQGRWVLIFFGFTHCQAICPRALARLSKVLEIMGPLADQIQPLYITVDPQRDTPEVMKAYLEERAPRFTGLTGSPEEIDEAKRAFRVFAQRKADPEDPDGYTIPHTAITYVLSPDGKYTAHFTDALDETEVAQRLHSLIATTD